MNQRCYIMPTLVEIGPSNASQWQHRRKDATEQIKNQTIAGSRTLVPGFSSADAITTKPLLPLRSVGRSKFDKGRHNLTTLIHKNRHLLTNC